MERDDTLNACRSALRAVATRLADLIRALPELEQPLPDSEWTARQAVAHLVTGLDLYSEIATGTPSPIAVCDVAAYAEDARRRISDVSEPDPAKLAYLLVDASDRFLSAAAGPAGDTPVTWHGGMQLDLAALVGLMVGEVVVHGYDIARAVARPWPLVPDEVGLVLGTYGPLIALTVDPDRTRGLSAAIDVELRGLASFVVRFDDGQFSLEEAGPGPVDATLSADPTAFLLVTSGRMDRWSAFALGLYGAGGTRPELAVEFQDLFVFP
ncbi:MAG: maleylpyruvate isomerase family mycothiol-dependent enzyme [Actinobacteria bacterium]|nr:maleylpyruvate isomerase family mycothiol-dependent enzyme [Actinomycetota bacterium]